LVIFKIDGNFWAFIRPETNCRDIPHKTETVSRNSRFPFREIMQLSIHDTTFYCSVGSIHSIV